LATVVGTGAYGQTMSESESASADDTTTPARRVSAPLVADERTSLEAWLDYHRETLLWKCEGLADGQLRRRAVPPSRLSLLGLVRHMVEVERWWFRMNAAGEDVAYEYCTDDNPDGDFDDVDTADPAADLQTLRREFESSRAAVAGRSLEDTFVSRSHRRGTIDLRWVYVHMIEEYARHNGHADLIREVIDGATGD
jgi:Protein of unknown function (DUF664)